MDIDTSAPQVQHSLWKGKYKALDQDFSDLNPAITYRHILSQNLGVNDPLRTIALCDCDAFYASCEMVRLGVSEDTPLVVEQWESLIAVNYAARKFGISRMDKSSDAKKRCPVLKVVHVATFKEGEKEPGYWGKVDSNTHKVSLDYYRRESMKVNIMLKEGLIDCEIEKASIDEAFIDLTKAVRITLFERYPYLAEVPPEGIGSLLPPPPAIQWNNLGHVVPLTSSDSSDLDTSGRSVGANPSLQEVKTTWHDVALSIAAEMVAKVRREIHSKLGYTLSAGIARNKFLAKLAASYKKPNDQSILRNCAISNYLKPIPFQKIRFLGGKLGKAIAKEYEASTVGDLLYISLDDMRSKFGEECIWVYEVIRGIDRNEVKDKGSNLAKSMLAAKSLPKPITKPSDGYHWIRVLAAELALRLKDARELSPNLWPRSIALLARLGKGYDTGRSKQAPFPFIKDITVDAIASAGRKLWQELVGTSATLNVTHIQLAFTGIDVSDPGQQTIEGFLSGARSGKRPFSNNESRDNYECTSNNTSRTSTAISFVCPKCKKAIQKNNVESITEAEQEEALSRLRTEHEDFHFAQDLSRDHNASAIIPAPPKKRLKLEKKRKETQGIEKFFPKKS
ncbi:hypothetical protein BDQ17DRAFT_1352101 [Cyathus striatus]|nr:hypothetical protein BDQ17DRAFT_1352101 [Cyathus striatus]